MEPVLFGDAAIVVVIDVLVARWFGFWILIEIVGICAHGGSSIDLESLCGFQSLTLWLSTQNFVFNKLSLSRIKSVALDQLFPAPEIIGWFYQGISKRLQYSCPPKTQSLAQTLTLFKLLQAILLEPDGVDVDESS